MPLYKVDSFCDLLEEHAFHLSCRQHLSELIPFILHQEKSRIKEEIAGKQLSVIFDGTTHVEEALAIVLRFVDDDYEIKQRLACIKLLKKSMTGEELARVLISTLSTTLGVESYTLIAAMRDRASVNNVAMRTLALVYPSILDVGCFSHTIDLVGGKFNTPTVDEFTKLWTALFSRSPKACLAWKTFCGRSVPTYSETRWWSRWEVMKSIHDGFGDVEQFIKETKELAPATLDKVKQILSDPVKNVQLKMELAVVIDAGELFVKSTYTLEGDGPLALCAYEEIRKLYATITTQHFPNTFAVARHLSSCSGSPTAQQQSIQQLVAYAVKCVQPGFAYFKEKFDGELHPLVNCFKAPRMFSPIKMSEMQVDSLDVDELASFPFLNEPAILTNLKSELHVYVAPVEDISPDIDILQWWKNHQNDLPRWSAAFKSVILVQPSSATSERVFSLLANSFQCQQSSSLEDYIEVSLMLQYNKR